MKCFLLLVLCCCGWLLSAAEWASSYSSAKKQALRENKKILIFFSGSDWCEAGRNLNRDLFRTRAFQSLANEKYVLYNADFPKYSRLGPETEAQNKRLARQYGIHRFPALVVVDPKFGGLLVKQVGMTDMTPKKLLERLSRIEKTPLRSKWETPAESGGKTDK